MRIIKFSGSAKYRIDEEFGNLTIFRNLDNFLKFKIFTNLSIFYLKNYLIT